MKLVSNLIEAHIFREKGDSVEFLLLKRSPEQYYPNLWQMVSGKIKDGEKAFETAIREIKEETSLKPARLWIVPNINSFYSSDSDSISLIPVFAARVEPDVEVRISNEHSEWNWFKPEEAKKILAWDGQRKSVDLIVEYFFERNSLLKFVEIEVQNN